MGGRLKKKKNSKDNSKVVRVTNLEDSFGSSEGFDGARSGRRIARIVYGERPHIGQNTRYPAVPYQFHAVSYVAGVGRGRTDILLIADISENGVSDEILFKGQK